MQFNTKDTKENANTKAGIRQISLLAWEAVLPPRESEGKRGSKSEICRTPTKATKSIFLVFPAYRQAGLY
jgi:hypothetical protein